MLRNLSGILVACIILNASYSSAFFSITAHNYYCVTECLKEGTSYYWCRTLENGWDYCSPFRDTTYKGLTCREGHGCGGHGEDYYWCYTDLDNNWDYCGITVDAGVKSYVISDTYKAVCVNDCKNRGFDYKYCNTLKGWDYCNPSTVLPFEQLYLARHGERCIGECKGYSDYYYCDLAIDATNWEYCSPLPFTTTHGKPCRKNHACERYEQEYYWCYTDDDDNWDYCSPHIDCAYWPTDAYDCVTSEGTELAEQGTSCAHRSTDASEEPGSVNVGTSYCVRIDTGNRRQFTFQEEPNTQLLVPNRNLIPSIRHAIATLTINGINHSESPRNLVDEDGVRIDFQGFTTGRELANIQVQLNVPRPPGQSTTVAQIFIPVDEPVHPRYIRSALTHSVDTRTTVTLVFAKTSVSSD